MNNDDCVRYTHHKPPYKSARKYYFDNVLQNEFTPSCDTQTSCDREAISPDPGSKCGLLEYRKWWEMSDVDISVNGSLVSGMPIFIKENTLRVINQSHSFFIPMEKIDYIRTADGLCSCSLSSNDSE